MSENDRDSVGECFEIEKSTVLSFTTTGYLVKITMQATSNSIVLFSFFSAVHFSFHS